MSSGSEIEYDEDPAEYEHAMESENNLNQSEQNEVDQIPFLNQFTEQPINKMLIQQVHINNINQDETDKSCATYVFLDEDHTLGNALRYVLIHRPDVEFCGYSLPHPSDNKMNLRLQTIKNVTTEVVLNDGLGTLTKMCDILKSKFEKSLKEFEHKNNKKVQ